MNAYASFKSFAEAFSDFLHGFDHTERHIGDRNCMTRILFRQPTGHHIGIADRLDLFEIQPLGQGIESRV